MKVTIETLAQAFKSRFRQNLKGPRTIGREAEYTIVQSSGEAANAFKILPLLLQNLGGKAIYDNPPNEKLLVALETPQASYSTEVGLGTIEVITGPCQTLYELKEKHEGAIKPLIKICKSLDYKILGYGIQPKTLASPSLMSPKQRYQVLLDVMGPDWLYFCLTSSDQAQVDITQNEIIFLTNFGILMAPVIIALCANSSVCGPNQGYMCHREGLKKSIYPQEHRHGMIDRPYKDLEDFITRLAQKTCLMLKKDGQYLAINKPFSEVLKITGADLESFLMHDHYIWNSARARAAHSTIEIRPACQQPWSEHMVVSALVLGLIENAQEIQNYLDLELGPQCWPALTSYHSEVIKLGLKAAEPRPHFLLNILELAYKGLQRRGFKEEEFLLPLFSRLKEQINPAQKAQQIFNHSGLTALIDKLAITE